ncbi:MAG: apolipoprotein N-acyltransferase, partial [Sphingomicrobium sp.]
MIFLLALFAGAASAFAFEPVGLWPLMILAIAVLCELIARANSLRGALLIGWGFGVGQFCIGLNWIATAFTFQAAMPAWLGWIAVVLLSLYLAVYPMLAAGLAWRFGRRNRLALVLALAGGWAVTEWLRATMFTGFAWNPIGVALVDTPWRGVSAAIGTYGLSLLVALAGGTLWLAVRGSWKPAAAISAVLALTLALPAPRAQDMGASASIRIVQPNIGQQDKWREGFEAETARRLSSLSLRPAAPGQSPPSIIFWPEAAVTDPLADERVGASELVAVERGKAASNLLAPGAILVTGGLGLTSSDGRTVDGATNSVFVLRPDGRVVG